MNKDLDLKKTTEYIFSLDWDKDFTDKELDDLDQLVEDLITKYGWNDVYQAWCEYLHKNCKDDWSVVNFALHFFDYAHDRYIPDPVHFIAYLYYRVDTKTNSRAFDIFDSLAITILPNAGLLDMTEESNYAAETDPRIQSEIEAIRKQEGK
ncbi:hypothetical protein SAMN02910275_00152 [Butyrivibrio sp. INlla18]|uniref:hypothetical protein n=1 Tax=Butyrivibrio sp. INlla18 TaxID=1520806 RepID=UPI00088DF02C|nr:hypothetical protein [Butyrivibrio sp. INlla18]SDA38992.1 hypothetical protein SAMN02910275_00152 [Butyrivibrio sp. INlla18]